VLAKFDSFFKVRCQQEGKTSEQYIAGLYNLVGTCDYGNLKEDMIKDRLVVGIRGKALAARRSADARESEDSH